MRKTGIFLDFPICSNIFSFGAAPLQVNYHGYAGTTGLDSIDYIIGDKITIPEENQKYYSEKIIYMPNTYFPANNTRKISEKIFYSFIICNLFFK